MNATRNDRFLRVVEPQRERLWRFVRVSVRGDDELARDVMAETILLALERFHQVRDEQAIVSWLFTIARNVLVSYRRRHGRTDRFAHQTADDLPAVTPSPDRLADVALLHDAMACLSPLLRETLMLADVADMTLADVAAVQGATEAAVKARVSRARERLRTLLGVRQPLPHGDSHG